MIPRIIYVLLLLLVGGFCFFGFMATFEPFDDGPPYIMRIVYALGVLCNRATNAPMRWGRYFLKSFAVRSV